MQKDYDCLVFIGRFQPFHIGHFSVVKLALQKAHNVVVLIGSANRPATARNPLDYESRKRMIESLFSDYERDRIHIRPLNDYTYKEEKWISEVQSIVDDIARKTKPAYRELSFARIGLIGYNKDGTSYYLKLFPQWQFYDIPAHYVINATDIRHAMYRGGELEPAWFVNSDHQYRVVSALRQNPDVFHEDKFLREYKKQWEAAPYPPTFVTVDAVVVQSGHILMVERGAMPGEGLWALPGGFLNQDELIEDAAIRELYEETGLKVPKPVLKGSIVNRKVYDDPERSQRGRTITHAFHIALKDDVELPKVKGSDDAAKAKWIPLSHLDPTLIYEDHFDIIDDLLGL